MATTDTRRAATRRNDSAKTKIAPDERLDSRSKVKWNTTLWFSLASGLGLFAAMPPLDWWPLAWLAPLGWLWLIRTPKLGGRRPYLVLWATGLVHWLLVLQGIRHAHWAVWIGWFVLSAYLALYLPVFIGLTRVAVQRLKWPLALAAPVIWTGLEFARGLGFVGFSGGLLGHSQVHWLPAIQIADLVGAYGVSFVVMFVASCLLEMAPLGKKRFCWRSLAAVVVVMAVVLGYGFFRIHERESDSKERSLKVGLVQSSYDTEFDGKQQERDLKAFKQARKQTLDAQRRHPDLDLVVWPESVYTGDLPDVTVQGEAKRPPEAKISDEEFGRALAGWLARVRNKARSEAGRANMVVENGERRRLDIHLIVGTGGMHYGPQGEGIHNTALWITPEGEIAGRYHKTHPVMFGEYVPLGDRLPWLYQLMPIPRGLTPGPGPSAFEVNGMVVSPSICFESVVPQLIRRQCNELARSGKRPDFLVNVTNDGWFHGSSILDIHLTCGVFRAIENRTPLLISANGGPTAIVDSSGKVAALAARRTETVVVGTVAADGRRSPYQTIGDWPAALCLAFAAAMAIVGLRATRRDPPAPAA